MKVSLNWLKDYISIQLDPEKVGEILTEIGLEVEGMEEVESIKGGLKGVVVGYVKECGKHPNADKLSLTKVTVGGEEDLQIVCGAPNVAAGQKVLVATIGTTLYSPEGEAWKIKKGKIRGEVSEGMICAEDELGLGQDHSGIIVLPEDTPIGLAASEYYKIESDYVYEIGLTPNRSDATNHIGTAKDLAAALQINYNHTDKVVLPSIDDFAVDNQELAIEVTVENTDACPRYTGICIKGITVKESPEWLQTKLRAVDVRPINTIVDITNFILHELGQPLHAFDYDQIEKQKIIVKNLPEGTKFLSLDEVERSLHAEDLMICDGNSNGMCIGGVFGGIKSGVKDHTTNIFLEAAHFHAKTLRRTSMRHNLRTDAAKVFEKGSDPNIALFALKRAAMLIKELAGGTISSEVIDIYPNPIERKEITVRFEKVQQLIGVEIDKESINQILDVLEMDRLQDNAQSFTVAVPTNKSDVTREADVIEEILRIYGFNKVPIPKYFKTTMSNARQIDPHKVREKAMDYLAANGFQEIMSVSLSQSRYYKEVFEMDSEKLVYVNNTSNIHLDIMRPDVLFSGLEAIVHNQNRQQNNLRFFEFGKCYQKIEDDYKEHQHLSIFLTGQRHEESWLISDKSPVSFYALQPIVKNLLSKMGVQSYQETTVNDEHFSFCMQYHRGKQVLAKFGKVNPAITKKMSVRGDVLFADIYWSNVFKATQKNKIIFEELNKYPSTRRDLALVVDNSVKFSDIVLIAQKLGKKLLKDINLFDVYENEQQLGSGKKSYAVSFVFEDPSKTLKDKEVEKIMNQLIQQFETKLGAQIRR